MEATKKKRTYSTFSLRLDNGDIVQLQQLAGIKGIQPSVYVRMLITEEIRKAAASLDSNRKTR